MKILLIRSLNPFYESSASGNRFAGLIDGLLKTGVKINLIVTEGYNTPTEFWEQKKHHILHKNLKIRYTNCTFNHNIWIRRVNKFILARILRFISNIQLKKLFKSDFDFVWLTNESDILYSFNKYYKSVNGKTIIELNEFNDITSNGNALQRGKAEDANQNFMQAVSKIDLFAVMTRTLINHFQTMSKSEAHFLHLPMTVDLTRFQLAAKSTIEYKKPYIAFTGTYTNEKDGVDILIHAFAQIIEKFPDYHLYLAGFYHYDVSIQKKIISEYHLEEKITYLGVLNKEQIPPFIQHADLLVLSRPNSRQAEGGFPTKLGEYLASGNPVCVTRVGEISDYLEDNVSAFMAEPGSIDSFADAMNRALSDRENAKKVGLRGRKVAELSFNADIQARKLFDFLKTNL